jgi:predicted MFS family arabinose efflux permease
MTHMLIEVFYFTQAALIPVMIQEFHVSLLEASLVVTVPSGVALLAYIPSGLLADRLSANKLLFASMAIEGISIIMASQAANFWFLVAALCFTCLARPLYHASGVTQISRIAKPEELNMAMGVHNALGDLGTAAGVSSLAFFLSFLNWRWAYAFWAVPVLFWSVVVLTSSQLKYRQVKLRGPGARDSSGLSIILFSAFTVFLVFVVVRELGATAVSVLTTTYLVTRLDVPVATASLIFGLGASVGIVGDLASGYLGQKMGARRALSWIMLCCIILLFALTYVSQIFLFSALYLAYAFFDTAVWSPMHTLVSEITPEETRGLSYSVYFFAHTSMFSLAPVLAASFIQLSSISILFPFGTAFLVIGLAILLFLGRHRSNITQ